MINSTFSRGFMKLCRTLILILPFILLFESCSPTSSQDYQTMIGGEIKRFVQDLRKVKNPQDLQHRKKKLKKHFDSLANMIVEYNQFLDQHPESESLLGQTLGESSQKLKEELCRIYELDGGQQIIEEVQTDAYYRMGLFEHSKTNKRIDLFRSTKPAYQK